MVLDTAFILSAGKGTRMGKIGEVLPKPLFPIFESTLFELQYRFLKQLGIKRFIANVFHGKDVFLEYLKNKNKIDVELTYEEILLGTGGGIINAKVVKNVNGPMMICNSDSFYFFDNIDFNQILTKTMQSDVSILLGLNVAQSSTYNRLLCHEGKFKGVVSPSRDAPSVTYSGIGIINTTTIGNDIKFIDLFSILPVKENKVEVITPVGAKYYDFGTKDSYQKMLFTVVDKIENANDEDQLVNFLISNKLIKRELVSKGSYNYEYGPNVLNFSKRDQPPGIKPFSIILDGVVRNIAPKEALYFQEFVDEF